MTQSSPSIIDVNQLVAILRSEDLTEFWNVLTDEYFAGELIPGSRRVPLDRVAREAAALARETPIVVYCASPTCPQSHTAAEKLHVLGFTNVRLFEGGLAEWKASGRGVESLSLSAAA